MSDDDFTPVTLVYAGERVGSTNPRCVCYLVLTGKTLGEPMLFKWSRKSGGRVIGGMYTGASLRGGTCKGLEGPLKYTGKLPITGQIAMWEAEELAARTSAEETKLEKEDRRVGEIERLLLPLRKEYAKHMKSYDVPKAQALSRAVLAALQTPPRQSEL